MAHTLPTSLYQKVIHFIKGIPPYFGLKKCVVTSLLGAVNPVEKIILKYTGQIGETPQQLR